MSDYARLRVNYEKSTASDYSRPQSHYLHEVLTPDEHLVEHVIEAALAGTTLYVSHLASMTMLIVANLDATNFVTLGWTDSNAAAHTLVLPAASASGYAKPTILWDVDPTAANITLTADTAVCLCEVSYAGT